MKLTFDLDNNIKPIKLYQKWIVQSKSHKKMSLHLFLASFVKNIFDLKLTFDLKLLGCCQFFIKWPQNKGHIYNISTLHRENFAQLSVKNTKSNFTNLVSQFFKFDLFDIHTMTFNLLWIVGEYMIMHGATRVSTCDNKSTRIMILFKKNTVFYNIITNFLFCFS